jgi:hypothetical protein
MTDPFFDVLKDDSENPLTVIGETIQHALALLVCRVAERKKGKQP